MVSFDGSCRLFVSRMDCDWEGRPKLMLWWSVSDSLQGPSWLSALWLWGEGLSCDSAPGPSVMLWGATAAALVPKISSVSASVLASVSDSFLAGAWVGFLAVGWSTGDLSLIFSFVRSLSRSACFLRASVHSSRKAFSLLSSSGLEGLRKPDLDLVRSSGSSTFS